MKPNSLRGKYVSRAAFARMQAERNMLKKDLYAIVMGKMEYSKEVFGKWRKTFEDNEMISRLLKEHALRELPKLIEKYPLLKEKFNENPELL